jgi:hypothetical protein
MTQALYANMNNKIKMKKKKKEEDDGQGVPVGYVSGDVK